MLLFNKYFSMSRLVRDTYALINSNLILGLSRIKTKPESRHNDFLEGHPFLILLMPKHD